MGYDIDDGPDGDYDEDEFTDAPPRDEILEVTESEVDENGIKTIVEIRKTPEGKKIKKTIKVKVTKKEKLVNPKIEARKVELNIINVSSHFYKENSKVWCCQRIHQGDTGKCAV